MVSSLYLNNKGEKNMKNIVLNLILSGQLLIPNARQLLQRNKRSFKPYFRWLAPYTGGIGGAAKGGYGASFKPYFRWLAPYTLVF